MAEFEYTGWWWTPDNPGHRVPGTLTYTGVDGIRLSLLEPFEGWAALFQLGGLGNNVPLILGLASGNRVTLAEATPIRQEYNLAGYGTIDYRMRVSFIGECFECAEALQFSDLEFQPKHLAAWLPRPDISEPLPTSQGKIVGIQLGYERHEPERHDLDSVAVWIGYNTTSDTKAWSAGIKITPVFHFQAEKCLTVGDWYSKYLLPTANFLCLATGHPVEPAGVTVIPSSSNAYTRVQVLADNLAAGPEGETTLAPNESLIPYTQLNRTFGAVLGRWLRIHDELAPVLGLYFGIVHSPSMYLEHQLLSVVQALEGYHRRRYEGFQLAQKEHQSRVEAILGAAPVAYRSWLEEQLTYSNEKSLRTRLHELIDSAGEVLSPWVQTPKKKKQFVNRVVGTRSALTHYAPDKSRDRVRADTVFVLTEALSVLMQALLLAELGIESEQRTTLFRQNQRYQLALSRIAD